jgi:peptidoglycan/LPS O-acetylase OafA/YrhL
MQSFPARPSKLSYRPDIDGLRAIAVLLVVFNHLRTRVTGGYVGVDVFFVISGYLISSVILSDMRSGQFSIVGFYERRVRRIFPALLAMLVVVNVLAFRYLLPSEAESFARSLIAAIVSLSNFQFWREAGYFDAPSALKPLLHTWSLAVEEQFYIFFPPFLLAVRRWFPNRLRIAIWIVAGLSFVAACYSVRSSPSAAFFFSPLRAWELMIGTMVSQNELPAIQKKIWRNVSSSVGLLLILVPAFLFNAQTPFPGLAALPTCLGAGLIIASGETGGSVVASILSWRPLTFIGLISYSLYLWHWPIIVFWNRAQIRPDEDFFDAKTKLILLAMSLVAATLSWWLVETPFRKGRFRPGRRTVFLVNGVLAVGLLMFGAEILNTKGLVARFSPEAAAVAQYTTYHPVEEWRENVCFLTQHNQFSDFKSEICLNNKPQRSQQKSMLLLGDSLAAHLYPGLVTVFSDRDFSQANAASCEPLVVVPDTMDAEFLPNCKRMSAFIYGEYLPNHHFDGVLLAASWHEESLPELGRTIEWIKAHGMPVILFGPVPEYDTSLPRLLALSIREKDPGLLDRHRLARTLKLDKEMAELARTEWKVAYVSAVEDLCGSQVEMVAKAQSEMAGCLAFAAPGVPLQFDDHHFTVAGSILYARAMQARKQIP